MENTTVLATLVRELQELESDTFELHDYASEAEMLVNSSCSSTSSTTSSTCA